MVTGHKPSALAEEAHDHVMKSPRRMPVWTDCAGGCGDTASLGSIYCAPCRGMGRDQVIARREARVELAEHHDPHDEEDDPWH